MFVHSTLVSSIALLMVHAIMTAPFLIRMSKKKVRVRLLLEQDLYQEQQLLKRESIRAVALYQTSSILT